MPKATPTATYDDVTLLLRLYDLRREERMRKARDWFVRSFHVASMDDIGKICPMGSDENASYRMVVSYWDMVASFITTGVLKPDIFFESSRELLLVWVRMEKVIPALRESYKDPHYLTNLESVAKDYIEWVDKRSPGSYDAFAERIRNIR